MKGEAAQATPTQLPQVSVIVPAYNAAWCLERTLDSIAAQTYPRFEVLVVNDGSTDGTETIIDAFVRRDTRFRKHNQPNMGLVGARNAGLENTTGEFVAPIDADDLWAPDFLVANVEALLDASPEAPFSFSYSLWIDEDDRLLSTTVPSMPPRSDFLGLLRENAVGNGSSSVFRRAEVKAVGGYDSTLKARGALGGEDWKLSLQLAARHPAIVVPRPLVGYRITARSLSADPSGQARSLLTVLDDVERAFPDTPSCDLKMARTDFLVWLLPRWARARNWGAVLRYGALAYLSNPAAFAVPKYRHALKRLLLEAVAAGHRGLLEKKADMPRFQDYVRHGTGIPTAAIPVSPCARN